MRVVWVKEDKNLRRKVGFQLLEPRDDWVIQAQGRSDPPTPPSQTVINAGLDQSHHRVGALARIQGYYVSELEPWIKDKTVSDPEDGEVEFSTSFERCVLSGLELFSPQGSSRCFEDKIL